MVNASFTFPSFPSELEECGKPITVKQVAPQKRQLFRGTEMEDLRCHTEQDSQCTYNVTLRHIHASIVALEMQ
jgi:hypothetical protein